VDYLMKVSTEGDILNDPKERFTGLYDEHYRRVLRYALQHTEPGYAEDVASETFLIAWRRLAEVPEPPLPWLLGVARNLLLQQFGQARKQRRLADQISALTTDADLRAWDTGEHVVERAAALDALSSLNVADVEALTLVTWHGLEAAEAAAVAGCSPRAFTVRLHRARKRLAEALRRAEQSREHPPAGHATAARLPRSTTSIPRG
jgi:RNA polymerase sigma factor (sigma-70 family)